MRTVRYVGTLFVGSRDMRLVITVLLLLFVFCRFFENIIIVADRRILLTLKTSRGDHLISFTHVHVRHEFREQFRNV